MVDNAVVAELRLDGVNILYLFDESGTRIGMTYNGQNYYYLFNAQGDVTAIMNSSGVVEYRYVYDAWGKLVGIYNGSGQDVTDDTALTNVGYHNPIRYRGYYYDNETGLYYVSSRYYDPEIGRFISPDTTEILTATPMGLTDKNLYAYCDNNPVIRADHGGDFWNVVIGAAVGAVVGVAGQFISDLATSALNGKWTFSNWQTYAGAAVGGAVGGAILGGTGHVGLANAASGFVTTGVGMSLEKVTCASDKSWAEIRVNAVADGAISYGLGKLPGVKNVTKGRNNMSAVYRSGLTKLRNKTVSHMSKKVIGKGLVSGFVGGLAMDGYYGVKQYGYNRVRNRILRYAG